jgi:6-phosphogluconolactonase (cycloisomerase 2 family)
MRTIVRALLLAGIVLGAMWLSGCGTYKCGITFGSSTCSGTTPPTSEPSAFAFAVDQTNSTIDGYTLSASTSTFAATSPYTAPPISQNTGGVGMVVAQGKYLYAVIADSQQIYGYTIGSNGSLTALSNFPVTAPLAGVASATWNEQVVITNPAGTMLFISNAADAEILVYQISSAGQLTPASVFPFATVGLESQNMAMDGQGRFLYVADDSVSHSDSFVEAFSVSSAGVLTSIGTYSVQPCCWEMYGDGTGKYLVGISGNTNSISGIDDKSVYVYNIDQTTGALSTASGSPFTTQNVPFNIALQPIPITGSTQLIYSVGINDQDTATNPIEALQLNTSTGQITELSTFTSPSVSTTWVQFDPSGQYLFYYSGVAPTVSVGAMSVNANGTLTTIGTAASLTSPGYWAASDVP